MTDVKAFTPKQLSTAQYVLALHQPEDRVAVLVRNRARAQTIQRILLAEDIARSSFQDWLKEQNNAGADIFPGMNPLGYGLRVKRESPSTRTYLINASTG